MYKVILLIAFLLCRNYGGPQLSRQNQKPHGKTENLTAKTKTSLQKQNTSRQNQRPHGKTKEWKTPRQNQILHSKNQIPHGKSKYPWQNQSYFVLAVKYLVLTWGILFLSGGFWFCREVFWFCRDVFAMKFLVLLWCFCFCHEVFGFAVTVVGHLKKLQTRQLYRLTVNTSASLARIQTSTHPPYTFLSVTPVLQIPMLQKVYK